MIFSHTSNLRNKSKTLKLHAYCKLFHRNYVCTGRAAKINDPKNIIIRFLKYILQV